MTIRCKNVIVLDLGKVSRPFESIDIDGDFVMITWANEDPQNNDEDFCHEVESLLLEGIVPDFGGDEETTDCSFMVGHLFDSTEEVFVSLRR